MSKKLFLQLLALSALTVNQINASDVQINASGVQNNALKTKYIESDMQNAFNTGGIFGVMLNNTQPSYVNFSCYQPTSPTNQTPVLAVSKTPIQPSNGSGFGMLGLGASYSIQLSDHGRADFTTNYVNITSEGSNTFKVDNYSGEMKKSSYTVTAVSSSSGGMPNLYIVKDTTGLSIVATPPTFGVMLNNTQPSYVNFSCYQPTSPTNQTPVLAVSNNTPIQPSNGSGFGMLGLGASYSIQLTDNGTGDLATNYVNITSEGSNKFKVDNYSGGMKKSSYTVTAVSSSSDMPNLYIVKDTTGLSSQLKIVATPPTFGVNLINAQPNNVNLGCLFPDAGNKTKYVSGPLLPNSSTGLYRSYSLQLTNNAVGDLATNYANILAITPNVFQVSDYARGSAVSYYQVTTTTSSSNLPNLYIVRDSTKASGLKLSATQP